MMDFWRRRPRSQVVVVTAAVMLLPNPFQISEERTYQKKRSIKPMMVRVQRSSNMLKYFTTEKEFMLTLVSNPR